MDATSDAKAARLDGTDCGTEAETESRPLAGEADGWMAARLPESALEWFRAVTSLGEVAFGLWEDGDVMPQGTTSDDSRYLRAARRLGRAEPLICRLEEWLGVPLDLEPGTPTSPADDYLGVELALSDSVATALTEEAVVCLPLNALASLFTPPAELAAAMHWDAVSCALVISSVVMPRQQLTQLEPGGLLLMPASFEPFWRCQARLRARPQLRFAAELDIGQQRLIFEPHEPGGTNHPGACAETSTALSSAEPTEVVLRHDLVISVDRLAGWAEHPVFELGQRLEEFKVEIVSSQGVLAHGDLLSIGDGYGVFVREVTGAPGDCSETP